MEEDCIKTMYVRDPRGPRVVTIVRQIKERRENSVDVEFAYTANAVRRHRYLLGGNDAPRFKYRSKWYEGDSFNRKRGRKIALSRLEQNKTLVVTVPNDGETRIIDAVFEMILASETSYGIKNTIRASIKDYNKRTK